jgi:RNA polymerase-associated protein RTF1
MASLDDDLLALAGDSSDEENIPPQSKHLSASPQSPASEDVKNSTPEKSKDMARKGVAKAVKASKPARRAKKQKRAESDDEGEV